MRKIILLPALLLFSTAFAQQPLGIFDGQQDIGSHTKPGSGTYIPQTQQYVVSGSGYNIWFDHDEFHFVYKKMKGDFILYTRAGWSANRWTEILPRSTRWSMATA
jgi:TolB protein